MADTDGTVEDPITNNETESTYEPVSVTFADVSAARFRIRDGVPQTTCEVSKFS